MTLSRRLTQLRVTIPVAAVLAFCVTAVAVSSFDASARPPSAAARVATQLAHAVPAGQAKPTVVLVHGAWADTSSWNGEVAFLRRAGYPVRAIANPLENLTTDSETVADFLQTVTGPIILVGHSYGGSVITNAAAGNPHVKALVYVDAAAPAPGETNGSLSGSDSALNTDPTSPYDMMSYPGAPAGAKDLYLKRDVFVHSFGEDLPVRQADQLWATQRTASTEAFQTPSKYAAWKTVPSWYFISTGDRIITPTSEIAMAHRAGSRITLFRGGSHLTLVSHPAAVTSVIASAIATVG